MIRVVKQHVVFPVSDPERVKAVFPQLRVVKRDDHYICAVPHDLATTRFFRNKGHDIPAPIDEQYTWPGRFTPFAHQKRTAAFLAENQRAYLLSGLGTGKTSSALWATDYLMRQGEIDKCLVIAPLSTLERVWAQEIFQVLPHRRCHILHGSRAKREALLKDRKADIYVINHDGIEIIADLLATRPDINHIIIDELSSFRSAKTTKFKTMFAILNRQGISRSCWGMTGTPTPNAPTDCYGQVRLITPERYKGSFRTIQNELMYQISQFKWVPKSGAAERVNELMKPSIRYALEDCIDLPPTIWQERTCELSAQQQKAYTELKRTALTCVDGTTITAVNAGVLLNKLLQTSCFGAYGKGGEVKELDFGPRFNTLCEVIEECNEKIIIFVPFTGALNALYDKLKRRWSVEIVDGSVSAGKRNKIFKAFQEERDPHILLAHPGTMAHGLTLTAATTICWYGPITSNEIFSQANARIVRPGQTKVTNIVTIQGSKVEEGIYRTLRERGKMLDLVLKLAKES